MSSAALVVDPTRLTWWDCEDCDLFQTIPPAVAERHKDGTGHSVVRVR